MENPANKVNDGNDNLSAGIDTKDEDAAFRSSNKNNTDEILPEGIDDPPDNFFDELLNDDFLDSLAVVDTWNQDDDGSSDVEVKQKYKCTAEEDSNSIHLSKKVKQREEERKNKNKSEKSDRASGRDKSEYRRNSEYSNRDGRGQSTSDRRQRERYRKTDRKRNNDSKERSTERNVHRIEKGFTEKELHNTSKDTARDKSAAKKTNRRERSYRDSMERIIHGKYRINRDGKEKYVAGREKDNRRSSERYLYRSNRDKLAKDTEESKYCKNKDKIVEGSVHRQDRNVDHIRTITVLKQSSTDISTEKRSKEKRKPYNEQEKEKDPFVEEKIEEMCEGIFVDVKEILRESIQQEHNLEKEMTYVSTNTTRVEVGNKLDEEIVSAISDNVKPNNPLQNDVVLDTCIKELNDLVPPGTEEEFILPSSNVDENMGDNATIERECHEIVSNNEFLSQEKNVELDCIKLADNDNVNMVNRLEEQKTLESDKDGIMSSSKTSHQVTEGMERVCSPVEQNVRSESKQLGKISKRKRSPPSNFCGEEREYEKTRARNELFNEAIRKRRHQKNDERETIHVDSQRLEREKIDRLSSSGDRDHGRDKDHCRDRERFSRSISQDRQYKKTTNGEENYAQRSKRRKHIKYDIRSSSQEKQHESIIIENKSRSQSRESQYRKIRSKYYEKQRRSRKSVSREWERKRKPLQKSKRSPYLNKYNLRALDLSPVSVERRSSSPSLSFELSSESSVREYKRSLSRSLSRECRSYEYQRNLRGYSFSPVSNGSAFSCSYSLSSLSDESCYKKRKRRKRSPFWKEIERKFAKNNVCKSSLSQPRYSSPSTAGTVFPEGYNSSSHHAPGTFGPPVPYSASSYPYAHGYPNQPHYMQPFHPGATSHPSQADNLDPSLYMSAPLPLSEASPSVVTSTHVQPPVPPPSYMSVPPLLSEPSHSTQMPSNHIVPPLYTSAPLQFSNHPPTVTIPAYKHPSVPPPGNPPPLISSPPALSEPLSSIMAPTHVHPLLPPPLYNVPHSSGFMEFANQLAPSNIDKKFPSSANTFEKTANSSDRPQPSQVPLPPQISKSRMEKKMSLSSILEASAKVGGTAKKKQMSLDPMVVVRCEETIRALQINDLILTTSGHFILQQEQSQPCVPIREETRLFQSPLLRKPDVQFSFTAVPVYNKSAVSTIESYHLPGKNFAASVRKKTQPYTPCVTSPNIVTSSNKSTSTDGLKSYANSSTMTDFRGGGRMKVVEQQTKCLACLKHKDRIMIWNATQTPQLISKTIGVQTTGESPTGKPPMGKPPMGKPPMGKPPTGKPPMGKPPMGKPPTGKPPTGKPPMGKPPTGEPPTGEPPTGEPPMGEPPKKPRRRKRCRTSRARALRRAHLQRKVEDVSNEVDKSDSVSELGPNNKTTPAETQVNLPSDKKLATFTKTSSNQNINKEEFESKQQSSNTSTVLSSVKGDQADGRTFSSIYQASTSNQGNSSLLVHPNNNNNNNSSRSSNSSSNKVSTFSPAKSHENMLNPTSVRMIQPLSLTPLKGILKTSSLLHQQVTSQQRQLPSLPLQMQLSQPTNMKQTSLSHNLDLSGFPALSSLQTPKPLSLSSGLKDFRSASGLCNLRSGSSSSATLGSSSAIRSLHMLAGASHGSMLSSSTNTNFPQFGKSGVGNSAKKNQHQSFFPSK